MGAGRPRTSNFGQCGCGESNPGLKSPKLRCCRNTSPTGEPVFRELIPENPSGQQDLNLRPLASQTSALPDCAMPRGAPASLAADEGLSRTGYRAECIINVLCIPYRRSRYGATRPVLTGDVSCRGRNRTHAVLIQSQVSVPTQNPLQCAPGVSHRGGTT